MKKLLWSGLIGVVLLSGMCRIGWAREKEEATVLDTVIVTDSVKQTQLVETPGSITVLTKKDIRNSAQNRLAELIAAIPGVVNQKAGSKTYFSIRGARGSLSPGAVIYVDGRPINTGLYRYSKIDAIPLDTVEKIEVIKSPCPAIYGANASRGVILITTGSGKDAAKPLETTLSAEYGGWRTARTTTALNGAVNRFNYSLAGHAMRSDGYRQSDDALTSIDGKAGYRFDGGSIDLAAGHNDAFSKYPTGLDEETAEKDPGSPGYVNQEGFFVQPNQSDEALTNIGLRVGYDKNEWLLNASLVFTRDKQLYQRRENHNSPLIDDRRQDYEDDRKEQRYDLKLVIGKTFSSDRWPLFDTLTLGADYLASDFDQRRSYPHAVDPKDVSTAKAKADIDIDQTLYAFNAANDFTFGGFRLLAGARVNHVRYDLENQQPTSMDKTYNGDMDWNIAPSWAVVPDGNLFVSYSDSHYYLPLGHYKSDMEYDHAQARAGNLAPERCKTWEAGFKHRFREAFNYSVIYYHTTISDKVVSFYDGTRFSGYRNAGTSVHQGIEIELDGRPLDWLGYRLTVTTIDAVWNEGVAKARPAPDHPRTEVTDLSGKTVHNVPAYEYAIGLDFYLFRQTAYGSLTASVDLYGFGEQYEDYNNNFKMAPADFTDLKLTWSFGRYEVYLNSTNIFDRQWCKYVNSTGVHHGELGGMGGVYPQDGRYIGIGGSIYF